jgi:hypothetical protein
MIPAIEQAKTVHAFDRATATIGRKNGIHTLNTLKFY